MKWATTEVWKKTINKNSEISFPSSLLCSQNLAAVRYVGPPHTPTRTYVHTHPSNSHKLARYPSLRDGAALRIIMPSFNAPLRC